LKWAGKKCVTQKGAIADCLPKYATGFFQLYSKHNLYVTRSSHANKPYTSVRHVVWQNTTTSGYQRINVKYSNRCIMSARWLGTVVSVVNVAALLVEPVLNRFLRYCLGDVTRRHPDIFTHRAYPVVTGTERILGSMAPVTSV